jgi:hypothetical protein
MWGLLALVVRKGSNFDPLLCGLSPPVSGGRLKAHMYTFGPLVNHRIGKAQFSVVRVLGTE